MRSDPDHFIGFASVNPAYRGVGAAVEELRRAVTELGLSGVKLYPMYQHWAANDPDLAFPIYQAAQELGIPVMIHQAGSTRIDAKLELGRPAMLDDIGREFRDLRVIIAHCGLPWVDEALFLLTKHPNFYTELSYLIATPHPARPLPAALALRADVRPAGEAVLRHRLSGVPLRPGEAARQAPHRERRGAARAPARDPAGQDRRHHGRQRRADARTAPPTELVRRVMPRRRARPLATVSAGRSGGPSPSRCARPAAPCRIS